MYCWGAKKEYRKIPKISPGAFTFQRPLLRGLFLGGAYIWGWGGLYMEGLIFGILRYFFGFHGNKNFDIVNFLQNAFGPFVSIGSPVLSQTEGNLRRL